MDRCRIQRSAARLARDRPVCLDVVNLTGDSNRFDAFHDWFQEDDLDGLQREGIDA
jgi:hypothetical protein